MARLRRISFCRRRSAAMARSSGVMGRRRRGGLLVLHILSPFSGHTDKTSIGAEYLRQAGRAHFMQHSRRAARTKDRPFPACAAKMPVFHYTHSAARCRRQRSVFHAFRTLFSVQERVVDGVHRTVRVRLGDQHRDLDLAGGDHADVDVCTQTARSNMRAATPGWLCTPAPTMLTFATSCVHNSVPGGSRSAAGLFLAAWRWRCAASLQRAR